MIKRILCVIMAVIFCIMVGCADSKIINGKKVEPYGFINKDTVKQNNIQYRVCIGNVMWGVLLIETVVFPVYFFGFSLYEPVNDIKPVTK